MSYESLRNGAVVAPRLFMQVLVAPPSSLATSYRISPMKDQERGVSLTV
jgi:hypothetical protein